MRWQSRIKHLPFLFVNYSSLPSIVPQYLVFYRMLLQEKNWSFEMKKKKNEKFTRFELIINELKFSTLCLPSTCKFQRLLSWHLMFFISFTMLVYDVNYNKLFINYSSSVKCRLIAFSHVGYSKLLIRIDF